QARPGIHILGPVVVKLIGRDDLSRDRGFRLVVAEHAAFDLARVHGALDDDLAIVAGREPQALHETRVVLGLADSDAAPAVRWLHEAGEAEGPFEDARDPLRVALQFDPADDAEVHDRQAGFT